MLRRGRGRNGATLRAGPVHTQEALRKEEFEPVGTSRTLLDQATTDLWSDLIPMGTPRFRSGIGVRSATSQSSTVAPLNNHSQAETRYWLAMLQIPVACLDSVRCDMIEAVGDKAEPDAAGFRHRLAKRPDPIKLSCAPTFHVPAFLRTEGSARKSGKVAVGPVILNIDPDCGTGADRAREPSSGVRQRN